MDTFNWLPNQGVDIETDFQVREVQFGEGVVQVQQKFLSKPKRKFSLTFERSAEQISPIYQFLLRQRSNRFLWQRATETIKVRCVELSLSETGIVDTLTCTFQEEHY